MSASAVQRISVIDTHTGGEPTRVVTAGGPDLGHGSISERVAIFRARFDDFRSAVVNEPRGSDAMVGALLCEPADPACAAGVIYFNNVGYLGMCGHGTIGVAVALAYLGRLTPGLHRLETNVGVVTLTLDGPNHVSIDNVASYRLAKGVAVDVPGLGVIHGDIAWGGNWFFLVSDHDQTLDFARVEQLTDFTWRIRRALNANKITGAGGAEIDHIELFGPPSTPLRRALNANKITGAGGAEIDHIELFGPPSTPGADSKNFVLCPGKAYDRSPCGTGTSAKLACLVADGKLKPGDVWRQESIVGSVFEGSALLVDGKLYPRIRGSAYVNAEATLILDPNDPFVRGIRP